MYAKVIRLCRAMQMHFALVQLDVGLNGRLAWLQYHKIRLR